MTESPPVRQLQQKLHNPVLARTGQRAKVLVKRVETMGLEPTTPCLQSRCSSQLSYVPESVQRTRRTTRWENVVAVPGTMSEPSGAGTAP